MKLYTTLGEPPILRAMVEMPAKRSEIFCRTLRGHLKGNDVRLN